MVTRLGWPNLLHRYSLPHFSHLGVESPVPPQGAVGARSSSARRENPRYVRPVGRRELERASPVLLRRFATSRRCRLPARCDREKRTFLGYTQQPKVPVRS